MTNRLNYGAAKIQLYNSPQYRDFPTRFHTQKKRSLYGLGIPRMKTATELHYVCRMMNEMGRNKKRQDYVFVTINLTGTETGL
jgi:hypothetical protein